MQKVLGENLSILSSIMSTNLVHAAIKEWTSIVLPRVMTG